MLLSVLILNLSILKYLYCLGARGRGQSVENIIQVEQPNSRTRRLVHSHKCWKCAIYDIKIALLFLISRWKCYNFYVSLKQIWRYLNGYNERDLTSAGHSTLPVEVLEKAAAETLNYDGTGESVMEMSHRSAEYKQIIEDAEKNHNLMNIPDDYVSVPLQGVELPVLHGSN